MKNYINLIVCFFGLTTNAQEIALSEDIIRNKADSYFNALEDLNDENLSEADKIYLQDKNEVFHSYCLNSAYKYYTELIDKFPNSKHLTAYLFYKGLMSEGLFSINEFETLDEAKRCLESVIRINDSAYYSKLSLFFLATICAGENNCEAAKKYILQLNQVESDLLNEFQKDYIIHGTNKINLQCQ